MIIQAIRKINPNAIVSVSGTDIDTCTIQWLEGTAEISKADIKAKINETQYQRDRVYPSITEQLDLLYHDMLADKGDKTGEWFKAVKKVKDDNPKS